jgi:hypothetical protein
LLFAGNGKVTFASLRDAKVSFPISPTPTSSAKRCRLYYLCLSIAVIDAKEYAMQPASLHQELRHEVRLMKLNMDHRIAMLDLTIDSLQRELADAAATQRQCVLALVGAMVFGSFCMLLAFMSA